jgi:hypothetical protein
MNCFRQRGGGEIAGFIPILWHGVHIHHRKNAYSTNRAALLDEIAAAGFRIGKPPLG